MKKYLIPFLCVVPAFGVQAKDITKKIRQIVDSAYAAHPATVGIMVHVEAPGCNTSWSYAVGYADKIKKTPIQPDQPVVTASNTKTYVAATILRLQEQGKLNINESVDKYLPEDTKQLMVNSGYSLPGITISHLMSHTSGIDDFVDDAWWEHLNTNLDYRWTREEQLKRAFLHKKPLAAPGDTFKYADVNYLLLGQIIETCTHKPFYKSLRQLLDYKRMGLHATWFTGLEKRPANVKPLVHQYWSKYSWDTYQLDQSFDLYGGGGIFATPADMAKFFQRLFEGDIVKDEAVLAKMYEEVPCKAKTNYCRGIRKLNMNGVTGYYHGGFWGTDVIYFPELNASVCIVILERTERGISSEMGKQIAAIVKENK